MFLADTASIGIMDAHVHRARRELLNPLFSRQNVAQMEGVIWYTIDNLCSLLRMYSPGKKIGTKVLFKMITSDIISAFCYGKSFDSVPNARMVVDKKGTERPNAPRFIEAMAGAAESFWFMQRFWRLQKLLVSLPDWVVDYFKIEASLGMRDLMTVRFLLPAMKFLQ